MNATPTPQAIDTDLKTILKGDDVSRTTSTLKEELKTIHTTMARNSKNQISGSKQSINGNGEYGLN